MSWLNSLSKLGQTCGVNKANFFFVGFLFGLSSYLAVQAILPTDFLFADDWEFLVYLDSKKLDFLQVIELYNQHQMALPKFVWFIYGMFWLGNPIGIALFNSIALVAGLSLLAYSQLGMQTRLKPISILVIMGVVLNGKQIHNVSTLSTTSWALGIFSLGVYFYLKSYNKKSSLIYLVIFLSPFTNGIGLIVPINEVIQQIIIQLKKCFRVEKAKLNNLSLATSVISIFAAYIVPILVFGYSSQEKVRLQVDIDQGSQLISDWLESSLHYFRWFIILIGSVFTPSNRFNTAAAETIGIIATISFVLYVIKFTKSLEFIKRTLGESNCSIAGGIYILGILLTRGDSVYPLLWATSPRYVTGTIIFCLGLVSAALDSQKVVGTKVNKYEMNQKFLASMLVISIALGIREGFIYQSLRHRQAKEIVSCLKFESVYRNFQNKLDSECLNNAFITSSYNVTREEFRLQLYKYLIMRQNRT